MSSKIQIYEVQTETILQEFEFSDFEKAQKYALEMENLGLEIKLKAPSLPETLARELGASKSDLNSLKDVIDAELESHNQSPCEH